MIFLDAAHSVMDGTFSVTDAFMIGGTIGGGVKLWYGQVQIQKKSEAKIEALAVKIESIEEAMKEQIEAQKEYFRDAKESRKEIRRDYKKADVDHHKIMNDRVDKLQKEAKEDRKDNKVEFAAINEKLGSVSTDTKAILMMLTNK
jgi:hypothetical protein